MTAKPLFSVVIPTYQRNDLLAKCLDCLAPGKQTLPTEKYEVIVTDDGSETTAKVIVRDHYPWARWVAGPCKGPAANRNNGACYAQGEWLVFTDDDCLPDPQWLKAYAEAIAADSSCLVFEGRTYVDRPRRSLAEKSPINETGGYLWSCNFAIQKQLFDSLDGFDERFPYAAMEDVDLRLRITNDGYGFSFIKAASVCHPWREKEGWTKLKKRQKSVLFYLSLHPEESKRINSYYYFNCFLRSLTKNLAIAIKLKDYSIQYIWREAIYFLQLSILVLKV